MRINKYQVVHRIGELVAQSADALEGLQKAACMMAEVCNCDACVFLWLDDRQAQFLLVAQHGLSAEDHPEGRVFKVGTGCSELLLSSQKALTTSQAKGDTNSLYSTEFRSILTIPLITGGRTIGALDLLRRKARKFSTQLLETAQEIAPPLAIFLMNAMLARQKDSKTAFLQPQQDSLRFNGDQSIRGRTLSTGVCSGRALLLSSVEDLLSVKRIPSPVNTTLASIESEKILLLQALEVAQRTCRQSVVELAQTLSEADVSIFSMHAMMMDDPTLRQMLMKSLEDGHNITTALGLALRYFSMQYSKIDDPYLRERIYDIKDVLLAIKNASDNLKGTGKNNNPTFPQIIKEGKRLIIVAKELLPSQLIALPLKRITGILCEEAGTTSHIAILSRALRIPMLTGVQGLMRAVGPGDSILLDCAENTTKIGHCFLQPSLDTVRNYAGALRVTKEQQMGLTEPVQVNRKDPKTADGTSLHFHGNIALASEMPALEHYGIEAVGLYRTEFMFMIRNGLPTEDAQVEFFSQVVRSAKGAEVTLRVLDAGGDKPLPYMEDMAEENPAIGLRGMRFLLSHRDDILLPHLRALLRVSTCGPIRIMFPMISDVTDVVEAKAALTQARENLEKRGIAIRPDIPVGIMLEIPSACEGISALIPMVDFVSIGSNDLVQFLFAVDRGNPMVARWCRKCHPILLQLIRNVCREVAKYPEKRLSLCGELASSRQALPLLIGAGVRYFSMTPARIPVLREIAPRYSVPECEKLLEEVLHHCASDRDVRLYLEERGI